MSIITVHSNFDESTYRKRLNESIQENVIRLEIVFRQSIDEAAVERQKSKIDILIDFFESTAQQTPLLPIDLDIERLDDSQLKESAKKLIVVLSQLPNLRSLKLINGFRSSGFEVFAEHFQDNQTLEKLQVCVASDLEPHISLSLRKLLQGKICLCSFALSSSSLISVNPDTLRTICSKEGLQVLNLDNCHLKDDSMPHIISSVSSNSSLKHLSLRWNEFEESTFDLAEMLQTNTSLRSLRCDVRPRESANAFAFVLQKNTTLRRLTLCPGETYWTPKEAPFLASMEKNYTLEKISVDSSFIPFEYCREQTSRNKNNRKQKKKTLMQMLLPLFYRLPDSEKEEEEVPKKHLL